MISPMMVHPTAIPTTAPVLSLLPEVGAGFAGDEALVIWVSGMIEVEVQGVVRL